MADMAVPAAKVVVFRREITWNFVVSSRFKAPKSQMTLLMDSWEQRPRNGVSIKWWSKQVFSSQLYMVPFGHITTDAVIGRNPPNCGCE